MFFLSYDKVQNYYEPTFTENQLYSLLSVIRDKDFTCYQRRRDRRTITICNTQSYMNLSII